MIHLLSCCVQLNFPERQNEPCSGRDDHSGSYSTQVDEPHNHKCDNRMPGTEIPGAMAIQKAPKSKQAQHSSDGTDISRESTQARHSSDGTEARDHKQQQRSDTLNKQDEANILGAVPSRRVPCSNTEGPGFDSPCTHQVYQETQTEVNTHKCTTSVMPTQIEPPSLTQEPHTTVALSVESEQQVHQCKAQWKQVHKMMLNRDSPAEVQQAADTAM